ncbi:MAG TPA: NDP-sugar synthase [Anaerolineae bacterium]|nr:NDP-sugar synthase [Anaerolineae bacterium]
MKKNTIYYIWLRLRCILNAMRALLLAAGQGARLRPLTLTKPKALMPIANRPAVTRLLDLLRPYEIGEIYVNLHLSPRDVKDAIGGGGHWDARVYYSYEPELLGTAGAIKKVGKLLAKDRFLLVNTDIVTDIDFSGALEFHEETGARATLILTTTQYQDPDYQQIGVSSDGRILYNKAPGDNIRSGVYTGIGIFEPSVIEMIPAGYSSLLDSVLIPLASEGTLYAYFAEGYWMDIGRIERYIQTNMDVITGKTRLPVDGRLIGDNIWFDESAEIDLTVRVEEPALIGKNVRIERGTQIGPYVIIGEGCSIGPGVEISNSILWNGCNVGASSSIENSISTDSQRVLSGQRLRRVILHSEIAEPIFNI